MYGSTILNGYMVFLFHAIQLHVDDPRYPEDGVDDIFHLKSTLISWQKDEFVLYGKRHFSR